MHRKVNLWQSVIILIRTASGRDSLFVRLETKYLDLASAAIIARPCLCLQLLCCGIQLQSETGFVGVGLLLTLNSAVLLCVWINLLFLYHTLNTYYCFKGNVGHNNISPFKFSGARDAGQQFTTGHAVCRIHHSKCIRTI